MKLTLTVEVPFEDLAVVSNLVTLCQEAGLHPDPHVETVKR